MKNYGEVALEDIYNKEQGLITMHYNPNAPVDTVFSAVIKFYSLCILTDQPTPYSQLTEIAFIIFNKT